MVCPLILSKLKHISRKTADNGCMYLVKTVPWMYHEIWMKENFTQREIRQALNISKAQCSRNMGRLRAMEYITSTYSNNQRKVKYKIDYWDNYAKLRAKIKDDLTNQINEL
jgi:predicted transcriptional regulator